MNEHISKIIIGMVVAKQNLLLFSYVNITTNTLSYKFCKQKTLYLKSK